jgi:uncharacterized phiE125 gp8 family phage protein
VRPLYGLTLQTAAATEPVTLAEMRLHLKVDDDMTADDALISSLIAAARDYAEMYTRRAFVTQTWDMKLDGFPWSATQYRKHANEILIPKPPLQSISSITYTASDGTSTTLAASGYSVDTAGSPGSVYPAYDTVWPVTREIPNAVTIRFVAGYGAIGTVPESIKAALKLLVGHWYENRETVVIGTITSELPKAVDALLWGNRILEA